MTWSDKAINKYCQTFQLLLWSSLVDIFNKKYQRKDPYYEMPSSFQVNAKSLLAEFKKIIGHFERNLISFKIMLYKI